MKKVLFVCLGNICRSPAAEGIFRKVVRDNNLSEEILVDSAGTIGYHEGELPDERMRELAASKGYVLDHRARKFDPLTDFEKFDYIITMDDENYSDLLRLDTKQNYKHKIFKMADIINDSNITEVPDPYYGSKKEFEFVINLLEKGSINLLSKIKSDVEGSNQN